MSATDVALNPVPPLMNGDKPPFVKHKLFRIAVMVIVSMAVILHLILMFQLTLTTSGGRGKYCIVYANDGLSVMTRAVNQALDAGCTLVGGPSSGEQAMMCSKTSVLPTYVSIDCDK